ncbi:MAG: ATP-binding protein, partial [Serratia inhibens]|uniref:ATP-binding protein n=2 Tax=Serratia TaxID=613 RepID=UPI003C7BC184
LNIEPLDLPKWLEDKVEDMRLIHPEREIQLDIPHVGDFGGVDLRLMERVLDNLVNNALRYSEQRLRIGLWFDGDAACLQVEDDGPGIPPEERERVFEPFVRLDPSRDRATGGCGLGLAIVHSIAVAYQGQVYVDASSLGGASFRFCWPVKPTFNLKAEPV